MPLKHGMPTLETFIGYVPWRARVGIDAGGPQRYYSGVKVWGARRLYACVRIVCLCPPTKGAACLACRLTRTGLAGSWLRF